MKHKKEKLNVGDTVYFETPDGIYSDTILFIDGQELVLSDYNCLYKRNVLSKDDPRIKNSKGILYDIPPENLLRQQYNSLKNQDS